MTTATLPRWGNRCRDRKALAIWLTVVRACGDGVADGRWIDVGCGSGGIASTLAPKVGHMTGVDPEPWPGWAEAAASHANLRFVTGAFDAAELPVPEQSADVVICNQVYEHVADPQQLLANIHRVLVPGGLCYFAGPNLLWPIEPHVFWPFVHWLPRGVARKLMRVLGSKRAADLDAYSAHHWRLARWFHEAGLNYSPAVATRLRSELIARGQGWGEYALPHWLSVVIDHMAPLSPGFVYILRKPTGSGSSALSRPPW